MGSQIFDIVVKFAPDKVGHTSPAHVRDREYESYANGNVKLLEVCAREGIKSAPDFFEACVDRYPNNVFLRQVGRSDSYTYKQVDERANQVAHWTRRFPRVPVKSGGVVCFMMENCIEFPMTWLGISKAGQTLSMINTNLTGEALAHQFHVSYTNLAVISVRYADAFHDAEPILKKKGVKLEVWWVVGKNDRSLLRPWCKNILDDTVARCPTTRPRQQDYRSTFVMQDPCYFIFTSGTTGASKAARFSHGSFINCAPVAWRMQLTEADNYYNCLPMYHSASQVICHPGTMLSGASMIIREKFSASSFWKDIQEFGCTAMIHIGELWRYLYNQPVRPEEKNNPLRVIMGNGLRASIWPQIVERFQIARVVEFYGQSENPRGALRPGGSAQMWGKVGACGFIPNHIRAQPGQDATLLEYDYDSQSLVRKYDPKQGIEVCQRVGRNTPGMLVYELTDEYDFRLYTDKKASAKPLLFNVLRKGDRWYSTGDLLRIDDEGFMYFVDRTGDTFRWKGENVSTNEVSAAVASFDGVAEANVYGVKIPGTDGRAGMASVGLLPDRTSLDLKAFHAHMRAKLPSYAVPIFLRFQRTGAENAKTSTFKFQKSTYQKQGFDPAACGGDTLYFLKSSADGYQPLTPAVFSKLHATPRMLSKL